MTVSHATRALEAWRSEPNPCRVAGIDFFDARLESAAKAVCVGCDWRAQCAAAAVVNGDYAGVAGGLSPAERVAWARRNPGLALALTLVRYEHQLPATVRFGDFRAVGIVSLSRLRPIRFLRRPGPNARNGWWVRSEVLEWARQRIETATPVERVALDPRTTARRRALRAVAA